MQSAVCSLRSAVCSLQMSYTVPYSGYTHNGKPGGWIELKGSLIQQNWSVMIQILTPSTLIVKVNQATKFETF